MIVSNRTLHETPAFLSPTTSQIPAAFDLVPLTILSIFLKSHKFLGTRTNLVLRPFVCTADVSVTFLCRPRNGCAFITAHRYRCIMHWELCFNTFDVIRCDCARLSTGTAIDSEARKPPITGVFILVTDFAEKFWLWLLESLITWIILNHFKES